jgi:hypothetical protein
MIESFSVPKIWAYLLMATIGIGVTFQGFDFDSFWRIVAGSVGLMIVAFANYMAGRVSARYESREARPPHYHEKGE